MTYIGLKGYSIKKEEISVEDQRLVRKELTVSPFVPKSSPAKPKSFSIYRESPKKLYIPRFYGIKNFGPPDSIKIPEGTSIQTSFHGELRPTQKKVVKKYLNHAKTHGCGLLELYCGFGKTICALNIITRLQKKTLVIVHKTFLMNQWIDKIHEFIPNARIGKIQGENIDIEDKDIVLGMLQSISMKEYPSSIFKDFGLTIIDETHHIGAEVFSQALFKIVTKYMLGLSATMKRKDGLTKIFKLFLGDIVFSMKRESGKNVMVRSVFYKNNDEDYSKVLLNFKGHTHYALMIKKLCEFSYRTEFILKVLKDVLKEDKEKHVMILAHNKNILKYLFDAIKHRNIADPGYYIGGMKENDLNASAKKKVVIATYAMAEEGLDIKTLNTLIMATPKTDVVQSIGRILRCDHKEPLVIDIVDQHQVFKNQWQKRLKYYKRQKYKIMKTSNLKYGQWAPLTAPKKEKHPLLKGVCLLGD